MEGAVNMNIRSSLQTPRQTPVARGKIAVQAAPALRPNPPAKRPQQTKGRFRTAQSSRKGTSLGTPAAAGSDGWQ